MNLIKQSPHKQIIFWLLSGCALIYIMVVVGGLTRLTHSGLSITDWSFMGSIPPLTDEMWQERFSKYQQSPEFQKVNYSMLLEEFKPIFLWEYIHRMIGRIMMYVFAIGFIYFILRKQITKKMILPFTFLFLMGALQAVIGWWMVYSGLQKQPAVSHYRLATHLLSAFTLFGFTLWFALKLIFPKERTEDNQGNKLRFLAFIFFIVLIIQIIYGAFTAGYVENDFSKLRPGHIFNTWPQMGESFLPEQVYMKATLFQNLFENPSGIQFMHRNLAIVLVILLGLIWFRSNKLKLTKEQNLGVTFLIYGITIQFLLGIYTLINQVPIFLGALHQSGAFFLFFSSIFLIFHLFNFKSK